MSRGRGRPPRQMLEEAELIAKMRGAVMTVAGVRSDSFDLIICEEFRNVFVRCRSSAMVHVYAIEVISRYDRDIWRILSLPLTAVMAWEFWLRLPRGRWQFFLITHDRIVEIQQDGTILYRPVQMIPMKDNMAEESASTMGEDGGDSSTEERE